MDERQPDWEQEQSPSTEPIRRRPRRSRRQIPVLPQILAGTSTTTLLIGLGIGMASIILLIIVGALFGGSDARTAAEATATPLALTTTPTTFDPAFPLRLERPIVAWFAPAGDVFDALPTGTSYRAIAHYGAEWVQIELANEQGTFWVRSGDIPPLPLDGLPDLMPPASSYQMYLPEAGETVHAVAERGGSEPALLKLYNNLNSMQVGNRPLIVPQVGGRGSTLPATVIALSAGNPSRPYVALTIDLKAGDERVTQLLATLREEQVRVTFFVLGQWVEQHPELVRQIIADGHELANHSYSHPDFRSLSESQIAAELNRTEALVRELGGTTRPYFRPPYGAYNQRVIEAVAAQGYLSVLWNVDSQDTVEGAKTPEFLLASLTAALPPEALSGAIILTHCCHNHHPLPDVLFAALHRFRELGLEVRTLSEVLEP